MGRRYRDRPPAAAADLGRVELIVDVLNVLNDTAEESLATDNQFSEFRPAQRVHRSAARDAR